jgi:protein-disulfide isomerase
MDELAAEFGNRLNLDVSKLLDDRDAAYALVDADIALGQKLYVKGTPHFFVNGARVNGAQPADRFREVIAGQMAQASQLDVAPMDVYAESVRRAYVDTPPAPPVKKPSEFANVPVGKSDPARGAEKDYLVTVVEFSDYQCPFCQRVEGTIAQVLERYPDNVRVVFKHRPLPFHKSADEAAMAAVAAGKQGKYWQMHDALFAERLPAEPEMEEYTEGIAKKLGLKMKKFKRDRAAARDKVESDDKLAVEVGAKGTPTFFINGQRLVGAQPLEKFAELIDAELEFAKAVSEETKLGDAKLYDEVLKRHAAK